MTVNPLVSIIIPTYNRAHLIGETLDSIIAQTYTNWECIVVDDGSTDNTARILTNYCEKDTRFQYHKRLADRSKGANACRNYGVELSKGEYINWFDSDDIMLPEKIQTKIKYLIENKRLDVVFCECESFYVEKDKKVKKNFFPIKYNSFESDFILRKLFIQTASGLWKKSFIQNIKYDETLLQSQDYDFLISVFQLNAVKYEVKQVLYQFRRENESISNQYKNRVIAYVDSYLKVKFRILSLYRADYDIQKGIINHILYSLNEALAIKDKDSVILHCQYIKKHVQQYEDTLLESKWKTLNILTKIINLLGVGAYRFRNFYKII